MGETLSPADDAAPQAPLAPGQPAPAATQTEPPRAGSPFEAPAMGATLSPADDAAAQAPLAPEAPAPAAAWTEPPLAGAAREAPAVGEALARANDAAAQTPLAPGAPAAPWSDPPLAGAPLEVPAMGDTLSPAGDAATQAPLDPGAPAPAAAWTEPPRAGAAREVPAMDQALGPAGDAPTQAPLDRGAPAPAAAWTEPSLAGAPLDVPAIGAALSAPAGQPRAQAPEDALIDLVDPMPAPAVGEAADAAGQPVLAPGGDEAASTARAPATGPTAGLASASAAEDAAHASAPAGGADGGAATGGAARAGQAEGASAGARLGGGAHGGGSGGSRGGGPQAAEAAELLAAVQEDQAAVTALRTQARGPAAPCPVRAGQERPMPLRPGLRCVCRPGSEPGRRWMGGGAGVRIVLLSAVDERQGICPRAQVAEKQAALAALQARVSGAAVASAANRGLIVDMQARPRPPRLRSTPARTGPGTQRRRTSTALRRPSVRPPARTCAAVPRTGDGLTGLRLPATVAQARWQACLGSGCRGG